MARIFNISLSPGPDGLWSFRIEEENGSLTAGNGGYSSKSNARNSAEAYINSLALAETVIFTIP